MHILFLHNNFPGQFKWLVKHYATSGAEITFVSMFAATRDDNVRHIVSKNPSNIPISTHFSPCFPNSPEIPLLIICHSGFNCGLYEILFSYRSCYKLSEWWFSVRCTYQDTEFFSCFDLSSKLHSQCLCLLSYHKLIL